jgi:hypothetical protein
MGNSSRLSVLVQFNLRVSQPTEAAKRGRFVAFADVIFVEAWFGIARFK